MRCTHHKTKHMRNTILEFTLVVILIIAVVYIGSRDIRSWSKSGSTEILKEHGRLTISEGVNWYISEEAVLTQPMWEALDVLDIEYIMIENHVILISE